VLVGLNDILEFAGMAFEAAVLGLLIYRRAWRTLPFFFIYSVWTLLSDCGDYIVSQDFPAAYLNTYFVGQIVDFALQLSVLTELSWSIIRPFRASLPRPTIWILGGLIVAAGMVIWPFAGIAAYAHYPWQWHAIGRLQQTESILRVLFFLILAGCSQLLSIGWRDRELQVATGLGFYSFVSLTTTVLRAHETADQYRTLYQFMVASYLVSLLYWVVSFAQKEAERREFSPQMQGLLLAMAGNARSTRIALTGSGPANTGKRGKP
jgi:hypothetical protein